MNHIEIQPLRKPITAILDIPGSKSYTNRSLIMAALTKGPVTLHHPLYSEDTQALIDCLRTLGLRIEILPDQLTVLDDISIIKEGKYDLFAKDSGTTLRFLLAILILTPGTKVIRGTPRLNERPIQDLVETLRLLGAKIDYLENEGQAPLKIHPFSQQLKKEVILNASLSSQYLSALLMIAPLLNGSNSRWIPDFGSITETSPSYRSSSGAKTPNSSRSKGSALCNGAIDRVFNGNCCLNGLKIHLSDELISKPYVKMTIDTMRDWGVSVLQIEEKTFEIPKNQHYCKVQAEIEGDFSSASYFFAIAALNESTITLQNLNFLSVQADRKFLTILQNMGNEVKVSDKGITIIGKQIIAQNINMEDCPDQVQTMAVLAAFAKGATTIKGVRSLRLKETERVKAIKNELAKMGIKTHDTHDSLTIYGGNPHAAKIDTYGDHRMAMAFAVAGTKLPGIKIKNPGVVNKTFPTFWEKLNSIY